MRDAMMTVERPDAKSEHVYNKVINTYADKVGAFVSIYLIKG